MTLFQAATKSRTNFSFAVVARVDLRQRAELGVRAEDEVGGRRGPLGLARRAIAALVHVLVRGGRSPRRAHVEQVHEEVVGQRLGPVGEDAVLRLPEVRVQRAHAADENRHLGRGQLQEVGPVQQAGLRRQRIVRSEVVAEAVADRFEHIRTCPRRSAPARRPCDPARTGR